MNEGGRVGNQRRNFKTYIIYDKNQQEIKITNLAEWCRDNSFNYEAIMDMIRGKYYRTSCGYNNGKEKKTKTKRCKIHNIYKDKTLIVVDNLPEWCEKNNLKYSLITQMLRSKIYSTSQGYNNGK